MKKTIIGVVIVAVLASLGYLIFHTAATVNSTPSSSTSSSVPAVNNAVLVTKTSSSLGQYLTDPNGKALYTYDADTSGVSNCTGSCLAIWPAYQDKGSTANLPADVGTIKRTGSGQIQYTYMGLPLYYFVSDSPGHVTGNGVQNFKVAKPSASTPQPSPAPSGPSSANSGSPY